MKIFRNAGKFLTKNSSTILSVTAIAGVATTTILAVKATPRAIDEIREMSKRKHDGDPNAFTKKEAIVTAWKYYIPSAISGTLTICCILGANVLNQKQQAMLISAYGYLDQQYREYRKKVDEVFGNGSDEKVVEEIAKDKMKEYQPYSNETLLFYEENYGKIFERTMLDVMDAKYQFNKLFTTFGYATMNDFYDFLSLDKTKNGDLLGWLQEDICDFYNPAWIDFELELVTLDDGMECYIVRPTIPPKMDVLPF